MTINKRLIEDYLPGGAIRVHSRLFAVQIL